MQFVWQDDLGLCDSLPPSAAPKRKTSNNRSLTVPTTEVSALQQQLQDMKDKVTLWLLQNELAYYFPPPSDHVPGVHGSAEELCVSLWPRNLPTVCR